MTFRLSFLLLILLLRISAYGNDSYDAKLVSNRSKIKEIKQEIMALQERLTQSKSRELSTSRQIGLIDQEVALISRTKGLLEQQKQILEKRIEETNTRLRDTEERLNSLEGLYAERVIYAYKFGRVKNIEYILTASSFNQALVRYKYLKAIAEQDERTIRSIRRKREQIAFLSASLEKDLETQNNTIRAKNEESRAYTASKAKKQQLLRKIRKDQGFFAQQIKVKEEEQEKINAMIIALERQRRLQSQRPDFTPEVTYDFKDFKNAMGKLIWPVRGRIITRYGKQRDPESKTTINNTDIEIQSKHGTPVKTVFDGAVRMITYLSSYGNTIIVDHGKGYYTVYSHLDEIYVNKGDFVRSGDVIATVGDSGSLSGPKLQFGIYGETKTYNPEVWLGS